MKTRALVLALALTLPLALYGVPYAYATISSSSYVVQAIDQVYAGQDILQVHCNANDYATGGGALIRDASQEIKYSIPRLWDGSSYSDISTGQTPNAWGARAIVHNLPKDNIDLRVFVVCQVPVTVGGVTVPEFGQLYIAIALGALIYFLMAKKYSVSKTDSPEPI